jgi:hypothetical protein
VTQEAAALASQQPVTQEAAALASQQPVTQGVAIAPVTPQPTFIDPDTMGLPDPALIDKAFDTIVNKALRSGTKGASGEDKSLDPNQKSGEEPLPYTHPILIYQRYVTAREAWYISLPRGSVKTNQLYRKAQGLPIRYSKADFNYVKIRAFKP